MEDYGIPEILFYPSLIIELIVPILLIIGYQTRISALIMFIFTIVGTLLGSRLGEVFFYNWDYYQNNLTEILLPIKITPDGVEFTGLMCLFAKSDVPDEVKADVGKAIEQISGIKGFKKYMGKNDLAAFYTSSADATAAQAAMFKTMAPVVEKIIANN